MSDDFSKTIGIEFHIVRFLVQRKDDKLPPCSQNEIGRSFKHEMNNARLSPILKTMEERGSIIIEKVKPFNLISISPHGYEKWKSKWRETWMDFPPPSDED
jgi:hypothetical protein